MHRELHLNSALFRGAKLQFVACNQIFEFASVLGHPWESPENLIFERYSDETRHPTLAMGAVAQGRPDSREWRIKSSDLDSFHINN